MATKYWVGGTGTWDAATATNWSDTSGGSGGAIAPCALDDVVFNSASNALAYTVAIFTGAVCRDLTIAGPASGNVTVTGSGALGIFGSLTLPATGITRIYAGPITFRATTTGKTITTNGISLGSSVTFNGTGGEWTLGSAFNTTGSVTFTAGTLTTANYNFTCSSFLSGATGSGTINLGSSAVSCSQFKLADAVTLNAGTSSITCSSATASDQFGYSTNTVGHTYYNLTQNNITASYSIFANNTFNNLTLATITGTLQVITLTGNQTINGTFTASGSGAIGRLMLQSNVIGTARTLTVGTVAALTDVDFRDITVAGASSPWSGTRLGDCGGNTNITFGAGVNKYWNLPAGGAWTAAAWATSSGGTADVLNFPLAQDTVIIENTGLNTSASITGFGGFNLKTLDCSTRSNAATLGGSSPRINGNLTLSTSMTVTGLSVLFEGRTTQTITSAGRTLSGITVNNSGGTVTLADAYNGSTITLTSGTFGTSNQNVTLSSSLGVTVNSLSKTITLGSSTVSCSTVGNATTGASNFTLNAGTSSITASSNQFGILGVAATFYNVTLTSAGAISLNGTNTFNNLTFTSPTATGVTAITLIGNQTINSTLALAGGTSVTQRMGIVSDTPGTQRTITAATVSSLTDIDFRDIQGAGAGNWTTGTRLGNCGGNSGITFPAAKTVYWNLAGTNNWSATAWATGSGGSPAANNFPLAQDTAVFDDTGAVGTVTINAAWNIGTISAGGRTSAWTLAGSASPFISGDVTYGSGITVSNTGNLQFIKPATQVFTTAGKSIPHLTNINNPSCVFRHGDAYTSTSSIVVTTGTYETQNYNISITNLSSSNSNTRTITLGSSTLTLTAAASPIQFSTSTGLTLNAGTSTIKLTASGTKTFAGGGLVFNNVEITTAGGQGVTITGSNTFNTFSNVAYANLTLTSGTTQTFTNFNYTGASGSVVNILTSTPGLTATFQKSTGTWYAGANSTDGGNNTGWTFTAGGSTDYVYLKDIIAAIGPAGSSKFFFMFGN